MGAFFQSVVTRYRAYFADRGGPIIVAQVENELNGAPQSYVDWCGQQVVDSGTANTTLWVMCNGQSSYPTTVNSCNGFDCTSFIEGHGQNGHVLITQPAMWTEFWSPWCVFDATRAASAAQVLTMIPCVVSSFCAGTSSGRMAALPTPPLVMWARLRVRRSLQPSGLRAADSTSSECSPSLAACTSRHLTARQPLLHALACQLTTPYPSVSLLSRTTVLYLCGCAATTCMLA